MASEPIPEPLTNQDVNDEREPEYRAAKPRLSGNGKALNAVGGQLDTNPELEAGRMNPHLNRAAEAVGTTVGNAVSRARELSDRGGQKAAQWKEGARSKLAEMKQDATQTFDAVQQSASVGFQQAKEQVSESIAAARLSASEKLQQARGRARYLVHEYPLQVIAASAVLGLLTGILLRLWRSNRYE